MLVAIVIFGVISFISLKLCSKFALEDEERAFAISLVIAHIAVITGIVLCIIKLILEFNLITWGVFTIFILAMLYAFITGGMKNFENKLTVAIGLLIFGTMVSGLFYGVIKFFVELAQFY